MKLDGIGISGYRSFGKEMVYIQDLNKINIFIGKNNSGKSNILRFLEHLPNIKIGNKYGGFVKNLDYCKSTDLNDIQFGIKLNRESEATGIFYDEIANILPEFHEKFPEWINSLWLKFSIERMDLKKNQFINEFTKKILNKYDQNLIHKLLLEYFGPEVDDDIHQPEALARKIFRTINFGFRVVHIGDFRQITPGQGSSDINGRGLVSELRKLQSPRMNIYDVNKKKFDKINNFLRGLISEKDAFIEIPAEEDIILVSIKKKVLPLSSLGTGIHQLIILASAVTIIDDSIVCIEEPEIHLHPGLQKKFIKYIQKNTNNQYFISTHSNACFDIKGVNVYHCYLQNDLTKCDLVSTVKEKINILSDLGYKASDILQTNYIIWVEGPSDRIYLNHWIHGKETSFEEGLHYSIMFYGGRLLNHLAFDSPDVREFIQLCKMNRNAAIVIDSDKKVPQSRLNKTKKRIIENFDKNKCNVWVTSGTEIENYISEEMYNECLKIVHPKKYSHVSWGKYKKLTIIDENKKIDKVSVSKKVAENSPNYNVLDLDKKIDDIIQQIKKANS